VKLAGKDGSIRATEIVVFDFRPPPPVFHIFMDIYTQTSLYFHCICLLPKRLKRIITVVRELKVKSGTFTRKNPSDSLFRYAID
jgi:hypothetical protein